MVALSYCRKVNTEKNTTTSSLFVSYNNLRKDITVNAIDYVDDQSEIWTPELAFSNSEGKTRLDKYTFLGIGRNKTDRQPNALAEIDENVVYSGEYNKIILTEVYRVDLRCNFDLKMFPFDYQHCPIHIEVPLKSMSQMDIVLAKLTIWDNISMNSYRFAGFENTGEMGLRAKDIIVDMKLKRIITYHLFTTFLPTLCLIIIAEMTLLINKVHFEATIMVALTSMLVMYTLYQGVSNTLPQTSYLKMVDIWLLIGLIVPFLIILVLIAMDSTHQKTDQIFPKSSLGRPSMYQGSVERKQEILTKVVDISKSCIPVGTAILFVAFWAIALSHYWYEF